MRRLSIWLTVLLAGTVLVTGCGSKTKSISNTAGGAVSSASSAVGGGSNASSSTDASGTTCPTSNTTNFAKTKFALHAGLAFGAFHRYIYKPFRAGGFQKGANGRIKAFLKAGAAGLFAKREVRLAIEDVKANPTLCKAIAAPLSKLSDSFGSIASRIKGGDTSGISDANGLIGTVTGAASKQGTTITDQNANF